MGDNGRGRGILEGEGLEQAAVETRAFGKPASLEGRHGERGAWGLPGLADPLEPRPPARTLTRRRLLQAASAGAALLALGPALRAQGGGGGAAIDALSVGYLEGSDRLVRLPGQPWKSDPWHRRAGDGALRIVPADRLPLGDQSLASETVEMRVHGLYPALAPRRSAGFAALVLTVLFPSEDPQHPEPAPYYAWQAKLWPGASEAPPVRFPVPLRQDGGLELLLDVFEREVFERGVSTGRGRGGPGPGRGPIPAVRDASLHRARLYTDFTVDWEAGRPKLQRGFYLLGVTPGVWQRPWRVPAPPPSGRGAAGQGRGGPGRASVVVSFEALAAEDPRRG